MQQFFQLEERSEKYPELTAGILVKYSSHSYNLLRFDELTKREQQDNNWDTEQEHEYVRHRGCVTPLENFMRHPHLGDWNGYAGDSFFSGTVLKFLEDGSLRLGLAFSYKMDPLNLKKGVKLIPFKPTTNSQFTV